MNKITKIMIITLALLFIATPIVRATINPGDYDPKNNPIDAQEVKPLTDIAKPIANMIGVVGIVAAVITLAVLGIKYMTGSVSEKAEYKKTMIPYIIGVFLLVAVTQVITLIMNMVSKL